VLDPRAGIVAGGGPNGGLDGKYTVWGRVIAGMDVVDRIAPGEPPAQPTKIVRAYLGDAAGPASRNRTGFTPSPSCRCAAFLPLPRAGEGT